ncbi:MAG: hypothetical protein R3F55_23115 [Alphaproteobacteria bacterium]
MAKRLIIGCGRATSLVHNPLASPSSSMESPSNYITHRHRSKEEGDYTLDISPLMYPDILGDITELGFASKVSERFNLILGENLPGDLFLDERLTYSLGNINTLLVAGGYFLLRCGGGMRVVQSETAPMRVMVSRESIFGDIKDCLVKTYRYEYLGQKAVHYDLTHETYHGTEDLVTGKVTTHVEQTKTPWDPDFETFRKPLG